MTTQQPLISVNQPPLEMVVVEVTTWCNLKCPGCTRTIGEGEGTWKNTHMSLDTFRKVVNNLPAARQIVLHGVGEPTLNPDYLELIRHAKASGKFPQIVCISNGLARDIGYYESMLAAGMNSFTISVDSLTQEIADLTRTGTQVEKLRARLSSFRERNLPFSVSIVASRINLADLPVTLRALDEIGVDTVHIQPYIEFDDKPNSLKSGDITQLISTLEKLQPSLSITHVHYPLLAGLAKPQTLPPCSAPWRAPAVTVDGYMTPCCVKLVPGPLNKMDLARHPFDELQSSSEFGEFLNSYCDSSPEFCEGCFFNRRTAEVRPLVSVTMVTYNHAPFVREALKSVLAQTYSPLEIVISDDASTDETAAIIDACLMEYEGPHRVRFIRQPQNLGAKGRNNLMAGYRESQGKFIVWFCGDDVMKTNQVERMVDTWLKESVSLVTVNAEYIDEHSLPVGRYFRDPGATPDVSVEHLARDGANDCNFGAGLGFSRDMLEQFGFTEQNPPPHLPPDVIFPFYAGLVGGCSMIAEPLLKYRVHGGQTSLSLEQESASELQQRLQVERQIWKGHGEIAEHMQATVTRLAEGDPARFAPVLSRFEPLIAHQQSLMAGRLAAVDQQLASLADGEPPATLPTAREFERQATEFARLGDLMKGAEILDEAIGHYPDAARLWYRLARIMEAADQLEVAESIMENAVHLEPENSEYRTALSNLGRKGKVLPAEPSSTSAEALDRLTLAPEVGVYFIDVSDECNLRCVYCHQSQPGYVGRPMAGDLLESLQQMVVTHPPLTHAFLSSGGETTTLKDWPSIVQRFAESGVPCAMISNFARLFSDEEFAALAKLKEILISIDSIDVEITKRIRKSSDVKTILFNMQQLRAYCVVHSLPPPRLVWNVVGHDLALLTAPALAAAAVVYRPDQVTFAQMKPIPGVVAEGVRYIEDLDPATLASCAAALQDAMRFLEKHGIGVSVNEQLKVDLGLSRGEATHEVPEGMTRDCLMPWEMFLTHSDGRVKPCCNAEGVTIGHILPGQDPFTNVFNGEQMRAWRKSMLTGELTEACRICTSYPATSTAQLAQRVGSQVHGDRP